MSGSDFNAEDPRVRKAREDRLKAEQAAARVVAEANRQKAQEETDRMGQGDQG